MGTLLRYPYEVRSEAEYFDDIQDVKVTKDMLDLAKHIVNQKAGHFEPDKFEDQYETALIDLKEASEGSRAEEVGRQTATEVGLAYCEARRTVATSSSAAGSGEWRIPVSTMPSEPTSSVG